MHESLDPNKIKLAWKNLLDERCPKCECKLFPVEGNMRKCALNDGGNGQFSCDFIIGDEKFEKIKSKIVLEGYNGRDNFEDLQNL